MMKIVVKKEDVKHKLAYQILGFFTMVAGFFLNTAFARRSALSQPGKEVAVILLDVRVPVAARCRHEGDVAFQVVVRVVSILFQQRVQ